MTRTAPLLPTFSLLAGLSVPGAAFSAANEATPVDQITLKDGFAVELVYSVPKGDQGSWVAMAFDPAGRIIVSDQYGSLYRVTPGEDAASTSVEKIDLDIGHAQGLTYAFDSLYVVVNGREHQGRGLYRVKDTDGDDQFDSVELLRKFVEEGGEHGPHAVIPGPDGESLYVAVGNQTAITEVDHSRVPRNWDEDVLLPRVFGRGFMREVMAPGGWVAKTDPDGKSWELLTVGFRNQYDIAFDKNGELFTYDADMEWDIGTPWYRATRVCQVLSGVDYGWRNGSAKWPDYYIDTPPPVADVGLGSPTGVAFGYRAKFPKKYQQALFVCDWSFGKLYAVHLSQSGAGYTGEIEDFASAQPLPLTDLAVSPKDQALYFTIGGRRVQSGLYRITYTGDEPTDPVQVATPSARAKLRMSLEKFHGHVDPNAIEAAWPHLADSDRLVRQAARIAVESQPVEQWRDRALALKEPNSLVVAMVALARSAGSSSDALGAIVGALGRIDPASLDQQGKLELARAYSLALCRSVPRSPQPRLEPRPAPPAGVRDAIIAHLQPVFPSGDPLVDRELSELFIFLGAPGAVETTVALLDAEPTQEGQIALAKNLRWAKDGWDAELRRRFASWVGRARAYAGGASFDLFIDEIRDGVFNRAPEGERAELDKLAQGERGAEPAFTLEPRSFVKNWVVEDFDDVIAVGLEGGRDFENGRTMFGAGACFACHRFDNQGGAIGPDLTNAGGRFSPRDLLESIIEPSKEISDQYGAILITKKDGMAVTGRIANMSGDSVRVVTDMMKPGDMTGINRNEIESIEPSPVSMMPPGLLMTMDQDDVLDLLAYIIAGGDKDDPLFQ